MNLRVAAIIISMAQSSVPLWHKVPQPTKEEYVQHQIQKLHPSAVKRPFVKNLGNLIAHHCDSRDFRDAVIISFAESGFQNVVSKTQDFGPMQINAVHRKLSKDKTYTIEVSTWSLRDQVQFACRRIRWAKERGDLAYYHSNNPRHRSAYGARLKEIKEKLK